MASIDPKTMKKSGFWLEKCEFLKICACQSASFYVSSKVLISSTRSCLYFASTAKNVDFLAIFYCAQRSGIWNSRTQQLLTVYLRLQLQRQHNFVKILRKHKTNSTTVYILILRFR